MYIYSIEFMIHFWILEIKNPNYYVNILFVCFFQNKNNSLKKD